MRLMSLARSPRLRLGSPVAAIFAVAIALTAQAGPGDDGGIVVVVDRADKPELAISDLRVENGAATQTPVKIRIAVPTAKDEDGGPPMRWAELRVYLTTTDDPSAERLSETPVNLDSDWGNRSVVIDLTSPGAGKFYAHVEGEVRLADHSTVSLSASGAEPIFFGKTVQCSGIATVEPPAGRRACPLLFGNKSTDLFDPRYRDLQAQNRKTLEDIAATIDQLCADDALQRVSVRGWASTLNSVNPTNEELARARADFVVDALRVKIGDACDDRIVSDSVEGVQAATMRFTLPTSNTEGEKQQDNRCAQVEVTRQSCSG